MMDVSGLQDFVGRVAEKYPAFFVRLGQMESAWFRDRIAAVGVERPIFITGLARSGTTVLLEMLASHGDVVSHRYRDFPLLQIPVWWNWFLDRAGGETAAVERAHKDGIFVTADSPEAMEEILWMRFFPECHEISVSNVLDGSIENQAFESFYLDHIRKLLLMRVGRRYLAKGNYNIARLQYIARLFPDARFVIPVRDAAGHIASLMKQHELFCAEEKRDPQILAYMRRAGHFEFGLDRRPINFGCGATSREIQQAWQRGEEVRGWALYWAAVYGYVADLLTRDRDLAHRTLVVHYDDLCATPAVILKETFAHCELPIGDDVAEKHAARIAAPGYYSPRYTDEESAIIKAATEAVARQIRSYIAHRSLDGVHGVDLQSPSKDA